MNATTAAASNAISRGTEAPEAPEFDVVIVGAGFAGMYMLHRARSLGLRVCAIEKATDVGGVWYWNRYPGARCDVESMQYSYSFSEELQQEWRWSERFAAQPEILSYASHVAERFDLRRDIRFGTGVTAAYYHEAAAVWQIQTDQGASLTARFCIMATGCLSNARTPQLPGLDDFTGGTYHTGQWPHDGVDFSGQRVGVIGTGSSGIQAIPMLAEQARELVVFQRTPNFSVPARNVPMDDAYETAWKTQYPQKRQQAREDTLSGTLYERSSRKAHESPPDDRQSEYERRWLRGGVNFMHSFNDIMLDLRSNETAADFLRGQIRATVHRPDVAELLAPKDYPIGAKRICVDSHYYATFNRENVSLVDLQAAPIVAITPTGLQTADAHYALDSIVFATGYDAMTGALLKMDITGRAGKSLADCWQDGPRTYLGLAIASFPNLFTITGPGSPSVLSNMIFAIEQHVDWIVDCLSHLRAHGITCIEADVGAQDAWVEHVNQVADLTLYPLANSWYVGANVPGKARVFMPYAGGVVPYRKKCDEVAAKGYEGFHLQGAGGQPQTVAALTEALQEAP
ncbi:flavin-containing monooxygenase [Roseateles sp. GG27B]